MGSKNSAEIKWLNQPEQQVYSASVSYNNKNTELGGIKIFVVMFLCFGHLHLLGNTQDDGEFFRTTGYTRAKPFDDLTWNAIQFHPESRNDPKKVEWIIVQNNPSSTDRIIDKNEKVTNKPFGEVIDSILNLEPNARISHVCFSGLVNRIDVQKEVFAELEKDPILHKQLPLTPRKLRKRLSQKNNLFSDALMNISIVKRMNAELKIRGKQTKTYSIEEFRFTEDNRGALHWGGSTWLYIDYHPE